MRTNSILIVITGCDDSESSGGAQIATLRSSLDVVERRRQGVAGQRTSRAGRRPPTR